MNRSILKIGIGSLLAMTASAHAGNYSLQSLSLTSGKKIQILQDTDGKNYFLPALALTSPQLTLVQAEDDNNPEHLHEYGEVSFEVSQTEATKSDWMEAKAQMPGLLLVTECPDARFYYQAELGTHSTNGLTIDPPAPVSLPFAKGRMKIRVDRNVADILASGMPLYPLAILNPQIRVGSEVQYPISSEVKLPKWTRKTWEHRQVPYSMKVVKQFWALHRQHAALSENEYAKKRDLQSQALQLLINHPGDRLKRALKLFNLSKEEAYHYVMQDADMQLGTSILFFYDDPVTFTLARNGKLRDKLFEKSEAMTLRLFHAKEMSEKKYTKLANAADREGAKAVKIYESVWEKLLMRQPGDRFINLYEVTDSNGVHLEFSNPLLPELK
jgi:hypothetical protein